jgi:hypothetical protein
MFQIPIFAKEGVMELRSMVETVLGTKEPKRISDVLHVLKQRHGDVVWSMTKHPFMDVVESIDNEIGLEQAGWDKAADCGQW